jgi:hypothetical protein
MNGTINIPKELKFVDPKNDVAFRKIFGDENKKNILISFLKAREMAKTMKKEGEPLEKISRYTGLSKEEIEKL